MISEVDRDKGGKGEDLWRRLAPLWPGLGFASLEIQRDKHSS